MNSNPGNSNPDPRRRTWLVLLLIIVPLLLVLGWSQASFDLSFINPRNAQSTILLLALSALIVVAFVIFALILLRILLKLYAERRQRLLGSGFKTKMVMAFLVLSLVPVCVLFVFAYGLLNRSIDKWFGIPFDVLRRDANEISQQLAFEAEQRALDDSGHLAAKSGIQQNLRRENAKALEALLASQAADLHLEAALCFDEKGSLLARAGGAAPESLEIVQLFPALSTGQVPAGGLSGRWRSTSSDYFLGARQVQDERGGPVGAVVSVRRLPLDMQRIVDEIQREAVRYDRLSANQKAVKRLDLSILWLLTLIILFAATWFAMFFSKQVTVPIQSLAEATHEVSKGNLGFQVSARADGELGLLIRSFNEMTQQLQESRAAIEKAARDLQQANRELEERGNTMEAILESTPTGVISFNPQGEITRVNSTVVRMLGREEARTARKLTDLFSPEDARSIALLFRRAGRQGVVTHQMELELGARRTAVALTASSIRGRHGTVGSVLVLEDLTELLRAQKSAAWREVAQRLAHEIKNPLTPIQLSSERIRRLVERAGPKSVSSELDSAIAESAWLIGREVESLKTLVDEFSSFARFPISQPVLSNLNTIVESALNVFDGRLGGIRIRRELAPDLPAVRADPEQMKRAVVNLIDNAAEALEHSCLKEIWIRTASDPDRQVVELVVADSGPGISREARERLFLPYFSTKRRGTGLGLAIVSRIVSEHQGWIRVEENQPSGAKFIIELPFERTGAPGAPGADGMKGEAEG